MPKSKYVDPVAVKVDVGGQQYIGSYRLADGVVTAEWDGWTATTQAGASAENTAKQLVRELVLKHKS